MSWRIVDVFVVVISIIDNVVGVMNWVTRAAPNQTESLLASVSILRIVRVLRVAKLARVVRLLTFFRELRLMVDNILSCTKPLLWVIVILGMTFYVFAVALTSGVVSHLDSGRLWRDPGVESLRGSFGSLGNSLITLYMAMAGGKDWGDFYDMLEPVAVQYRALFLVFLTFTIFALLNVVTGVFVDAATIASQNNQQTIINEELHAKRQYLRQLKEIFGQMDVDHDGTITREEFTSALENESVVANFRALKLRADDAVQLFRLLDVDGSGSINTGEFLEGCYELQGETRNIDAKIMKMQLTWLVEQIDRQVPDTSKGLHSEDQMDKTASCSHGRSRNPIPR
jgi:Ca2+-binding EF-hand superfamily protein